MVRSMYSGVSGLRTHQTRMDTIGNNIANVNTYGYKSGRTTFRDIYYQTMSSASSPTAAQGGTNPSSVGYGTKVGSIDLMMGRSTFSMTDQTMDVAIDGEGFLQVMDGAGNTYYTRAGMLNFDAAGNLVDMQGNYVLGVNGDPLGRAPASERIQVALPPVAPAPGKVMQTINGLEYTVKATNNTKDSNLNLTFVADSGVADNDVVANITSTGITIRFNPQNNYSSFAEISSAVNAAVLKANNNQPHPAGDFTIEYTGDPAKDPFRTAGTTLSAEEICGVNYNVKLGSANFNTTDSIYAGIKTSGNVGNTFGAAFPAGATLTASSFAATYNGTDTFTFTYTINDGSTNHVYSGTVDSTKTSANGLFKLVRQPGTDENDYIEFKRPSYQTLLDAYTAGGTGWPASYATAALGNPAIKASAPSRELGFSGSSFPLRGGTEGGPQDLSDMTAIAISPNGVIIGYDSTGAEIVIGRIDLATFANPAGLAQAGSSNYIQSANSGTAKLSQPGESGAGKLVGGTLELSNVDLSREFSDMITTQRGYQANSRIITVSDTMLEELINLKR